MSTLTAMIVDDSRVARMTLSKMLKARELEVIEFSDAEQALQALQEQAAPDVIFMDMMMEGMDGLTATARIKSDPGFANIPVIICTGNDGEVEQHRADIAGAHSILSKPPATEVLDAIIAELHSAEPELTVSFADEDTLTFEQPDDADDGLSFDLSESLAPELPELNIAEPRKDAEKPVLAEVEATLNRTFVPQLQSTIEQQTRQLTEQLFEQLAEKLRQDIASRPAADSSLALIDAEPASQQAATATPAFSETELAEAIQAGIREQLAGVLNQQQADLRTQLTAEVMQSVQAELQRELQKISGKQIEAMVATKLSAQQGKLQTHLASMEQDWQQRLGSLKKLAIGSALAAIVAIMVAVLV